MKCSMLKYLVICLLLSGCKGSDPNPGPTPSPTPVEPVDTTEKPPVIPEDPADPVPSSLKWTDFLDEMVSWDAPTRFPTVAYTCRQESSYDRRSVTPGTPEWFANDDGWGYIRMEYSSGREEKVIFDEKHPGVISRMWLTSFNSPNVVLRFYLDGVTEPSFQLNTYNLKEFGSIGGVTIGDGLAQPASSWIRGSSMYLPISYSKSCKITIEEKQESTSASRYYHINYRRYPDDFTIETFKPEMLVTYAYKLKKANNALLEPSPVEGDDYEKDIVVAAGSSLSLDFPEGPAAIASLQLTMTTAGELVTALEGLNLQVQFDSTCTVDCPLLYFFGTGHGAYYMKSWRFECNGRGSLTSRWVMPYRNNAVITITNNSSETVNVSAKAIVAPYKWTRGSMYFHAAYHRDESVPLRYWSDYNNGVEWPFADIKGGRGLYVGDVYTVNNPTTEWPGEGDEKIWVDEEDFPSHFGTGVEDYFSFCGYFRFNSPFSGEPRLDSSNFKGINTHYRTRNLDAIPFNRKLRFYLEMEGHEAGAVDVESAVFWYGEKQTIQ